MRRKAYYKRLTYEDKFDRRYACNWKRGAKSIKKYNRRKLRRVLRSGVYD